MISTNELSYLVTFFKNENVKSLLHIGDNNYFEKMKEININYSFLNKIDKCQTYNTRMEWVLLFDIEDNYINYIHNFNRYGILLYFDTSNFNLEKILHLGYIRDAEYENYFNNKFIILRKKYYFSQYHYNLCLLYNKPSNLNNFINNYPKIEFIGSYFNDYRKYFINCNKNDFMIDIGANIGLSSCPILSLGNRVVCFEPEFLNYEILKCVKKYNNYENMFIENKALISTKCKNKTTFFSNLNREDNSSVNELCCVKNVTAISVIKKEVDCITLDEWYDNNKEQFNISDLLLIKIDVQGGEYDILKGAINLLRLCSFT